MKTTHAALASRVFHSLACAVLFVVMAAIAVSGCSTQQVSLSAADTCSTNAVVVSALADQRHAGLLSASQINTISADIAVIDPVCTGASPPPTLAGAAANAAAELATILAAVQS